MVPTFDGESYGLSTFFRIQWQRLHFSHAFVKGQWNAMFLISGERSCVKPGPVGRSYGSISLAQREELIVFANQTWKPQFLSVVQFPFDNCRSPLSPTPFFEIGV